MNAKIIPPSDAADLAGAIEGLADLVRGLTKRLDALEATSVASEVASIRELVNALLEHEGLSASGLLASARAAKERAAERQAATKVRQEIYQLETRLNELYLKHRFDEVEDPEYEKEKAVIKDRLAELEAQHNKFECVA
jgi:hypothetical protein